MDLDHLRQWIGRSEEMADQVSPSAQRRLAALLDYQTPPWPEMDIGPLGHWLCFLPEAAQSQLGQDGHPVHGGLMPPIALPRRMWAGSRIDIWRADLSPKTLRQRTRLNDIVLKTGSSGAFVKVTLAKDIFDGDDLVIREELDIIYREAAVPGAKVAAPRVTLHDRISDYSRTPVVDPALLFRFSALTFNAHRIHYDRDYATTAEGYPDLVVHGPLQAVLLADLFQRHNPSRAMRRFACRAVRPLFVGQGLVVRGADTADGARLWTEDASGQVCMEAEVAA